MSDNNFISKEFVAITRLFEQGINRGITPSCQCPGDAITQNWYAASWSLCWLICYRTAVEIQTQN